MRRLIRFVAVLWACSLAACSREPTPGLTAAAQHAPTVAVSAETRSTLVGRVLDEAGRPLEGVRLRLRPAGTTWSSPPPSDDALESATDAQGRFRFDVPVSSAERTWLEVEPDRFHALATILRGDAGEAGDPRLLPGTNTMRDIRLAARGSITGRVVGPDGNPIAGASIVSQTSTTTRDDGTFELGHVAPGKVLVRVSAPGLCATTRDVVLPRAGVAIAMSEVRLQVRPVIAGIVVDRDGSPVESVRITARPGGGGQGSAAHSAADGTFSVELRTDVAHALSADGRAGFLAWDALLAESSTFEPDTRDVRIVLDRWGPVEFAVVDAETNAPVENYGVDVREDARCGWRSSGTPPWQRVPADGVATLLVGSAPSIVDVRVPRSRAYGDADSPVFLDFRGLLALDADSEDRMTIRLERASRIRLRLPGPRDGRLVEVVARRVDPASSGGDEDTVRSERQQSPFEDHVLVVAPGEYELTVDVSGYGRRVIRRVRVDARQTVDLGAIDMQPSAIVVARLVLREGVSPVGLRVRVDDDFVKVITSKRGSFRLTGLAGGMHVLTLLADPPRVLVDHSMTFDIASGAVLDLRFDVRD